MRYLQYLLTSICFLLLPLQVGVAKSSPSLHYVSFTADELKNIQGHYSTIYGYLYIRVRGQNVSTQYDGKYIQLVKKSNGHFYPRYRFLWIFPIQIGNMSFTLKKMPKGKTQIIMHQNGKKRIVAQRFFAKPVPVAWKKRLGIYKASQLKGKTDIKKIRLSNRLRSQLRLTLAQKELYSDDIDVRMQAVKTLAKKPNKEAIQLLKSVGQTEENKGIQEAILLVFATWHRQQVICWILLTTAMTLEGFPAPEGPRV